MRRIFSAIVMVLFGVATAFAQEKKDEPAKDELPYKEKIAWEVKVFENDPDSFTLIKRTIDKDKSQVVWLLECNSATAAERMNTSGGFNVIGYFALLHDSDGVVIGRIKFGIEPASNLRKGDRVRATMKLPDQELANKTEKILIKYHE